MSDLSDWPALVLTAGRATRLRPLSDIRAKAALPVAGKPVVVRILEWLRAAGVRRVVLNLHHRPDTVTRLVGDGAEWDMQVRYSWESVLLGTGGGPRRAVPLLDADRFLIVNGDTLTDCDLAALTRRHAQTGARVTMSVVPGDVGRYGGVLTDADGVVTGFAVGNRRTQGAPAASSAAPGGAADAPGGQPSGAPVAGWHFIGVQAVDADAFAGVSDEAPSETVGRIYPELMVRHRGSVSTFLSEAEFLDIGTARDYLATVAIVAAREGRTFDRGADCDIHPDAALVDTVLWDRVKVGRGARLTRCVVADDVRVPDGARYEGSVLIRRADGLSVVPF
jgi:mannose-1-phosphate guanylyltransferase